MEARGIYFSSLVILLSLVSDVMGARTCTVADITSCLLADQPKSRTPIDVRLFCRFGLPKLRGCIHEVIDACQQSSTNLGRVTAGFARGSLLGLEYACSDANIDEYAQLSQCVDGPSSQILAEKCKLDLLVDSVDGYCRVMLKHRSCVKEGFGGLCGKQAGQFMESRLLHAMKITLGDKYSQVFSRCNLIGVNPFAKEIPKGKDPGQTPPDSQSLDKEFTPLKAGIGAAAAVILLACVISGCG